MEQIDLELPDPAVISGRSTSRLIHRVTDETPGTGNGGGPLLDDHQHRGVVDELFSSEVNLRNYMEVGWRRV